MVYLSRPKDAGYHLAATNPMSPTYVNSAPQYGSSSKGKRFCEKYYQNLFAEHMSAMKMDLMPSNIIMLNHTKSLPRETSYLSTLHPDHENTSPDHILLTPDTQNNTKHPSVMRKGGIEENMHNNGKRKAEDILDESIRPIPRLMDAAEVSLNPAKDPLNQDTWPMYPKSLDIISK